MHMRACACVCANAHAHVNLVGAVLLLNADIGSLCCCGLRLPYASQNSRENRVSLAYSSTWELGWALIPAAPVPLVHAPWTAQPKQK